MVTHNSKSDLPLRGTLMPGEQPCLSAGSAVQAVWCTTAHHGIKRLHNHDISIDYVMDHETWPIHDKKNLIWSREQKPT